MRSSMKSAVWSARPGAGRLLGAAVGGQPGEDEAGDQQVRREPAAGDVAQLVLQRLGEHLHAGLGDVVGRIARRRGDALLGAGVDDEAGPAAVDHARGRRSGRRG